MKDITLVVFGASGDLAKRKLAPAFARMIHERVIGKKSTIVGVSRKEWSDEDYRKVLMCSVKSRKEKNHLKRINVKFCRNDITIKGSLKELKILLKKSEPEGGQDRIFYLSTSFKFFPTIVRELKRERLHKQKGKFVRIMFEKPFGFDLKSSDKLDRGIHKVFSERDIYRVDHYLGKETVQNIQTLKFTNPVVESMLNKGCVSSVNITVDESLGVGKRIGYYNDAGAIKDMIQSHLLQVLSLVLMDNPIRGSVDRIHNEKVKILKKIEVLSAKNHLIGQYKGYKREVKIYGEDEKKTETFARIVLNCKNKRWNGVPLILRTGKKLPKKKGEIRINFKSGDSAIIYIYPVEKVKLEISKKPKSSNLLDEKKFVFCPKCRFGPNTKDEYVSLISEAINGDKTLFSRSDEIREAWKIVERINNIKNKIKFVIYRSGSNP